jgi:hypothetical protein
MKLAVIASGWHYAWQFYNELALQHLPENVHVDKFVISHRDPDHSVVIQEKQLAREYTGPDPLHRLDAVLYENIVTKQWLEDTGWIYIEKPNTIGDMEVFNQWIDDHDYREYDMFLITHDDNLILSRDIYMDVFNKDTQLYAPIKDSRYNTHRFKTTTVTNDMSWLFLDNGYSEYIPKAFTPRGSFSFYKRELIDMLPNNKFPMEGITVTRENQIQSGTYHDIVQWNMNAGNFRNFLYELNLIDATRWLSNTKRVSKYCIEGERGFIRNNNSNESHYIQSVLKMIS